MMALSDLAIWPIDRISDRALAMSAWQHYSNVGAYDAFYIATASGTAPQIQQVRRPDPTGLLVVTCHYGEAGAGCVDDDRGNLAILQADFDRRIDLETHDNETVHLALDGEGVENRRCGSGGGLAVERCYLEAGSPCFGKHS